MPRVSRESAKQGLAANLRSLWDGLEPFDADDHYVQLSRGIPFDVEPLQRLIARRDTSLTEDAWGQYLKEMSTITSWQGGRSDRAMTPDAPHGWILVAGAQRPEGGPYRAELNLWLGDIAVENGPSYILHAVPVMDGPNKEHYEPLAEATAEAGAPIRSSLATIEDILALDAIVVALKGIAASPPVS